MSAQKIYSVGITNLNAVASCWEGIPCNLLLFKEFEAIRCSWTWMPVVAKMCRALDACGHVGLRCSWRVTVQMSMVMKSQ